MTEPSPPSSFVKRADLLLSQSGSWPTFHDAELIRLELTRDQRPPELTMSVYTFRVLSQTDEHGRYRLANKCIVTLHFTGLDDFHLQDFNEQNVLLGLDLALQPDGIRVKAHPCYGADFEFTCSEAEVLRVEPLP